VAGLSGERRFSSALDGTAVPAGILDLDYVTLII
jgi:hypothetical protein